MKTIEEREDIFVERELPHNEGTDFWRDGYREGLRVGYHFGAIEQEAIDIEKACEWLRKLYQPIDGHDYPLVAEKMVEKFRKAMEE